MSLTETLKAGAIKGAMSFLSELLILMHKQFVAGTEADDETKKALKTFMIWYPEIKQGAERTDTQYDDKMIEEVKQYAIEVLGQEAWDEARGWDGPEDAPAPSEPMEAPE